MKAIIRPATLRGQVRVPSSKSHSIRAMAIAALADGESRIGRPLASADVSAARRAYEALGARTRSAGDDWYVHGTAGNLSVPDNVIDVGNSGTTLRMALGSCALLDDGLAVLTGDEQIRRRPVGPLAQSLIELGATIRSTRDNGCAPVVVQGPITGGATTIEVVTSQYLSSLLLNAPLAAGNTTVSVSLLNEQPYVEMTLDWIRRQGVTIEYQDLFHFHIPGGQRYRPVDRDVPADFSSATFFLGAGALGDNDIACRGLDLHDTQGDKAVIDYLRAMGAGISDESDALRVTPKALQGQEIDLNATPDALPMMAVMACFARGTTRLVNVPQARLKETDRIAVMAMELTRLGAQVEELKDGLVIAESRLTGTHLAGHDDHRVVMALAIAATMAEGETTIDTAEAVEITFPTFFECLRELGAELQLVEDDD